MLWPFEWLEIPADKAGFGNKCINTSEGYRHKFQYLVLFLSSLIVSHKHARESYSGMQNKRTTRLEFMICYCTDTATERYLKLPVCGSILQETLHIQSDAFSVGKGKQGNRGKGISFSRPLLPIQYDRIERPTSRLV